MLDKSTADVPSKLAEILVSEDKIKDLEKYSKTVKNLLEAVDATDLPPKKKAQKVARIKEEVRKHLRYSKCAMQLGMISKEAKTTGDAIDITQDILEELTEFNDKHPEHYHDVGALRRWMKYKKLKERARFNGFRLATIKKLNKTFYWLLAGYKEDIQRKNAMRYDQDQLAKLNSRCM